MIAVVTVMFPAEFFCDACLFLVPPIKTNGAIASSMVGGASSPPSWY